MWLGFASLSTESACGSLGAHLHTSWPGVTGMAYVVQHTRHPGMTRYSLSSGAAKGPCATSRWVLAWHRSPGFCGRAHWRWAPSERREVQLCGGGSSMS